MEFSPSSAVPGEETNMQVTALPRSLCGVSAIDKSVLIKEPGKTLDADKVTADINTSEVDTSLISRARSVVSYQQLMPSLRYLCPDKYSLGSRTLNCFKQSNAEFVLKQTGIKNTRLQMHVSVMTVFLASK